MKQKTMAPMGAKMAGRHHDCVEMMANKWSEKKHKKPMEEQDLIVVNSYDGAQH